MFKIYKEFCLITIMHNNSNTTYCQFHYSNTNITLGSFIVIAITCTYLPQYIKIIQKQSTEGISYLYLLLGNISNFTNFFGTLLLNYYIIDCCSKITAGHCMNILLPIYQMFTPWICIFILYTIYLIYDDKNNATYKPAFIGYSIFITVFIILIGIIGMIMIIHYNKLKKNVHLFGDTLNIISAITCVFTFLPQILKTYSIKKVGNLSLISLFFQTIGSFIVFIYQVVCVKASITIGVPYLVSGILQCTLLCLGYYYHRINKKYPELLINNYSENKLIL
jgi:uncharacterized protein with PQ loop repeat